MRDFFTDLDSFDFYDYMQDDFALGCEVDAEIAEQAEGHGEDTLDPLERDMQLLADQMGLGALRDLDDAQYAELRVLALDAFAPPF